MAGPVVHSWPQLRFWASVGFRVNTKFEASSALCAATPSSVLAINTLVASPALCVATPALRVGHL